jgi:hypothetical protein
MKPLLPYFLTVILLIILWGGTCEGAIPQPVASVCHRWLDPNDGANFVDFANVENLARLTKMNRQRNTRSIYTPKSEFVQKALILQGAMK